ncbi:MAG TPA: DUF2306 domain-containing protein [Rhodanobacteraceae bacterium]
MKHKAAWRQPAFLLLGLLCLGLAGYAFDYLFRAYNPHNPFNVRLAFDGLGVPAHLFGGGLALLLVPWQLSPHVRRCWPRLHRLGGWLSATAILVGAIGAFSLATRTTLGGAASGWGFTLLAMAWLLCIGLGIQSILAGDIASHRRWMVRCVALTTSSLTLRLMLAIGFVLHLPAVPVYITAAWTCWPLNLAVGEYLLKRVRPMAGADATTRIPLV